MAESVKGDKFLQRREFMDYVHGLIRFEMHKGEDNPERLRVLSNIHWDLNHREDLRKSDAWYGKKSGDSDELHSALSNLENSKREYNELLNAFKELTDYINENQTKKDIVSKSEEMKKKVLQVE